MAWGGGVFTRTYGSTAWQTDASNNVGIVADRHDTNDQDLADGINACINKAGGNTPTADLPMGGYKHTNLSAGTAAAPTFCAGNDQDTGIYSPAANQIGIATNGAERIRVNASGNLGIGTTSPGQMLDIGNGSSPAGLGVRLNGGTGNDSGGGVFFANSSTTNSAIGAYSSIVGGTQNNALTVWAGTGNEIRFITNGGANERMRITSAGRIGVGTSSPSSLLHLSAAGFDGAKAIFESTNSGQSIEVKGVNGAGVNDVAYLILKDDTNTSWIGLTGTNATAGAMRFATSSTERMRITAAGNVGIGTSAPSYLLQLNADSAAKPTTNTWTIASDARLKTNIQPYTKGLEAILQVEPITYDYNGKGGMAAGPGGISILAQALQPVFPECVGSYKGKLNEDDEEETDILNYNGHAMTFALINAVKELSTKLDALTERMEALEA